jgi:hypothetical protein
MAAALTPGSLTLATPSPVARERGLGDEGHKEAR